MGNFDVEIRYSRASSSVEMVEAAEDEVYKGVYAFVCELGGGYVMYLHVDGCVDECACVYLSLRRIKLHEGDGLQGVHLQIVGVLAKCGFHHSIAQHMSPL